MHNSKEIVNLQGLFVLAVGYVDMITYPLTKYYCEKSIWHLQVFYIFIIYQYNFILGAFICSIMELK